MDKSHRGLDQSPFRRFGDSEFFFPSATHEEALARLDFLVEQRHSLGILSGAEGTGKSTVLDVFAGQLRQRARAACVLNLMGLDVRGFFWSLAAGLGANPQGDEDGLALWRRIGDRFAENHLQDIATVLLLDDADRASHDVLIQVLRLLKTQQNRLTAILAVETSRMARLGGDLLQLSQLRIHLEPWDRNDVRDYLQSIPARAAHRAVPFDESAVLRLHAISGGVPRLVRRFAELAFLAATSQGRESIDADTVESVYHELSPTHRHPIAPTPSCCDPGAGGRGPKWATVERRENEDVMETAPSWMGNEHSA